MENKENINKGNRKVQGVPQSQTAALPRPQEEEETDKSKQAQTEQTKISSLFPKRGNRSTKRTEKHKNKMTHGKTYNKSPRRINKATKSKTNTGTAALERSVEQTTGGFEALLQLATFTMGPDATLNTEIHKNSVRIKAPNSVNASKRKHKNQINHYNKQRRVLMANSTVCRIPWKKKSYALEENFLIIPLCFTFMNKCYLVFLCSSLLVNSHNESQDKIFADSIWV